MKYYMFGLWEPHMKEDEPFKIYIGIAARNNEEAIAILDNTVDDSSKFILYDVIKN